MQGHLHGDPELTRQCRPYLPHLVPNMQKQRQISKEQEALEERLFVASPRAQEAYRSVERPSSNGGEAASSAGGSAKSSPRAAVEPLDMPTSDDDVDDDGAAAMAGVWATQTSAENSPRSSEANE